MTHNSATIPNATDLPNGPEVPALAPASPANSVARRDHAGPTSSDLGSILRSAATDAATSLRMIGRDPMLGMPRAYAGLSDTRARNAGLAVASLAALLMAGGGMIGQSAAAASTFGQSVQLGFFSLLLTGAVPPAAAMAVMLALRFIARPPAPASAAVFAGGVTMLPLGLCSIIMPILGVANIEVMLALLFVALAFVLLLLYASMHELLRLSSRAAFWLTPAALFMVAWISKIVLAIFLA